MSYFNNEDIEDVRDELLAEARWEKRKRNRFLAHPDPRDPDYPEEYDDPEYEDD